MSISRLIVGGIFLIAGLVFAILMFFSAWWMVFYSVPLIILGIVILLNKKEDSIEKRKDLKEKVYSK